MSILISRLFATILALNGWVYYTQGTSSAYETTGDIPPPSDPGSMWNGQKIEIAQEDNFHPETCAVNDPLPRPVLGWLTWWDNHNVAGYYPIGVAFTYAIIDENTMEIIQESPVSQLAYRPYSYYGHWGSFNSPLMNVELSSDSRVNGYIAYMINLADTKEWKKIGAFTYPSNKQALETGVTAGYNEDGDNKFISFAVSQKLFQNNGGDIIDATSQQNSPCTPVNPLGCYSIDGGGWQLVRHSYNKWHPASDNLKGTAVYGTFENNPQSQNDFSIQFKPIDSTEFMFSNGDCSEYLITTFSEFKDPILENPYKAAITQSHINSHPSYEYWYYRSGNLEDPWISFDHHVPGNCLSCLYGENNWVASNLGRFQQDPYLNVFIRADCKLKILGNDHDLWPGETVGKYFAFDTSKANCVLGSAFTDASVHNIYYSETGTIESVMIWQSDNVETEDTSIVVAHGRKDSGAHNGDWEIGKWFSFVDVPCNTDCFNDITFGFQACELIYGGSGSPFTITFWWDKLMFECSVVPKIGTKLYTCNSAASTTKKCIPYPSTTDSVYAMQISNPSDDDSCIDGIYFKEGNDPFTRVNVRDEWVGNDGYYYRYYNLINPSNLPSNVAGESRSGIPTCMALDCALQILGNDHKLWPGETIGKYFAIDESKANCILSSVLESGSVHNVYYSGSGTIESVIIWTDDYVVNEVDSSIGIGHGRKNSGAQNGDWEIGEWIYFVDATCNAQC